MSLVFDPKYIAAPVENPGLDVTKEYNLHLGGVESITIGDTSAASYTYTVASSSDRNLSPDSTVLISVTNGHFTVDSVLTIDKNYRQVGDKVRFVFTPSDIPAGRSIVIKDNAASPATLDTITSTSDSSRSTSTRTFALKSDGTWAKVSDVPKPTGDITTGSITVGGGSKLTKILKNTATWDPASVTGPNTTTTTITVTGAAVGNQVSVNHDQLTSATVLTGYVSAPDTVTVVLGVFTGTINVASGTLTAYVYQVT